MYSLKNCYKFRHIHLLYSKYFYIIFFFSFLEILSAQTLTGNNTQAISGTGLSGDLVIVKRNFLNYQTTSGENTSVEKDSTYNDSLSNKKKPLLLSKVKYSSKDYTKIDTKESKIYLYNNATLDYQDVSLKSGIIVMDYKNDLVYAGRIKDEKGNLIQPPVFKQKENEVFPDSVILNMKTKKALIWNSRTKQSEMNIKTEFTKRYNDSVYYIKEAILTTAEDVENPEYHIKVNKGKLIPGKKIIAGPSHLYIENVPTPLFVPFGYFPSSQKKRSGIIFPVFGENRNIGYFIQNGGYYLAISDNIDVNILGDYYTNGSYGVNISSRYLFRYRFGGNFNFRFENLVNGERGINGYNQRRIYNFRWSHSPDIKSSPNSRFSVSANFGSSTYYQNSLNQFNSSNFLNNTLSSSMSYSRSFPTRPRINMSFTSNMNQNTRTQDVNLSLPTMQVNMDRVFPFAPKTGSKKGVLQNINFQYSVRAENRMTFKDSLLFDDRMFENSRTGARHNLPFSTNLKVMKYLSFSINGNFEEVWTGNMVRYRLDKEENKVVKDELREFGAFRQYNWGVSLGTTLYGTFNFWRTSVVQSIRHVLRPSLTYGERPSFQQYFDQVIDENGNVREYNPFENSLFGRPSNNRSRNLGIAVSNLFEAKVKQRDTAKGLKKIKLLNNVNLSTSYNFEAESFKLAPIRVNTGVSLFKGKLNVNMAGVLDPYALDGNNSRIDTYAISAGQGLARLTTANINTGYSFNNESFAFLKRKKNTKNSEDEEDEEEEEEGNLEDSYLNDPLGGGRTDDLFGVSEDFTNRQNSSFNTKNEPSNDEPNRGKYYTNIPWSLRVSYALTYNNTSQQSEITNHSLMFSGDISLTPSWKIGASSGYDLKRNDFTYTQMRFERDLKSWRMNFSWVPFSARSSWHFFIGVRASILSDLKYEQRRPPDITL